MYYYILLYIIISRCVRSVLIKSSYIDPLVAQNVYNNYKHENSEIPNKTRIKRNLIYRKDGINLKLPRFSRPRHRFLNILEETSQVDYIPVESILNKVKDKSTFHNFSDIKTTFLQVTKWIFFRRKEIINHPSFTQLRSELIRNSSLFGAVYSRFLKDILKSSRLYGGFGIRNCLKFYIRYRDKNLVDCLSLPNISDFYIPNHKIPHSFFSRILTLCKNNDTIEVLKHVFENFKIYFKRLLPICPKNKAHIKSNWGYLCIRLIDSDDKQVVQMINEICKPKDARDFNYIKTGQSDLHFANKHYNTVLNLFSHVYKISNLIKSQNTSSDYSSGQSLGSTNISIINNDIDSHELYTIYFESQLNLLKLKPLEDYVATFLEVVDYLNKCVEDKSCSHRYVDTFIKTICRSYMRKIKGHFDHISNNLEMIYNDLFNENTPGYNLLLTDELINILRRLGLENFADIFNKASEETSFDKIYGILKDDNSTFLYDFFNSRIVTSSNIPAMDLKNLKSNWLDSVRYCHLIIYSRSSDFKNVLDSKFKFLRENFKQLSNIPVDKLVTLDLPNYYSSVAEFDRKSLKEGEIIKHPVNSELYITLNYFNNVPAAPTSEE